MTSTKPRLLTKRIRPVEVKDLDAVERFAFGSSLGITSLPRNRDLLLKKIKTSVSSFEKEVTQPEGEKYLFVLEDIDEDKVIGCCGIDACAGWYEPLFYFKEVSVNLFKESLGIDQKLTLLKPIAESPGRSSLCSLYLDKDYRKGGVGRLLSFSRFLFIALQPKRFTHYITAELRGVIQDNGNCPFYEGVLKPIIGLSFEEAITYYSEDKTKITSLLPDLEIYVELLPKEIQALIKKVHERTLPAYEMLKNEGFEETDYVDLFDGGPQVQCAKENIQTIKKLQKGTVSQIIEDNAEPPYQLVSKAEGKPVIAYGIVKNLKEGEYALNKKCASMLGISVGDTIAVRF